MTVLDSSSSVHFAFAYLNIIVLVPNLSSGIIARIGRYGTHWVVHDDSVSLQSPIQLKNSQDLPIDERERARADETASMGRLFYELSGAKGDD